MTRAPWPMRRPLPTDLAALARLHARMWQATYRGLMPDELYASVTVAEREAAWAKLLADEATRAATWTAWDGDALLGFVVAGPHREPGRARLGEGEVKALYVAGEAHGRGVGRCLMQAAAADFLRHGVTAMSLRVLAGNPAVAFYAKLGGVTVPAPPSGRHDPRLDERLMLWDQRALEALAGASA